MEVEARIPAVRRNKLGALTGQTRRLAVRKIKHYLAPPENATPEVALWHAVIALAVTEALDANVSDRDQLSARRYVQSARFSDICDALELNAESILQMMLIVDPMALEIQLFKSAKKRGRLDR